MTLTNWFLALLRRHQRQPAFVRGASCILLLALSGCALPGLRQADSGAQLPDDFNGASSAESSADIGLDQFFNDPVLNDLIIGGLAQNQELKIRNQEIQIAANEIMARRGAYLPFVNIGGGGGIEKNSQFTPLGAAEEQLTAPGGRRFSRPLGNSRLSADLFWQVDIWRQLRNARDAAQQRYYEAIEARNYLVTQLVAETAENYYELAALDKRLEYLDLTIGLQKQSLDVAKAQLDAARGTQLGVQRFLAEVRKNESQKLIVNQRIIEVQNRINFLVGRYPQPVERAAWDFIKLDSTVLNVGVPAQLLQNRRDIQAAERELTATGLDVMVARANFYPRLAITAGVGYEAFNPRFLFDPEAFVANAAGELVAPLINKAAIRAEYLNANARQLQAIYQYQRTVLNAFTEVVNRTNKVENYRNSVAIKQEQVKALEESVTVATDLFNAPIKVEHANVEYVDVLLAQRDLLEARTVLIETKQQQLSAIVRAYQALGGGFLQVDPDDVYGDPYCPPTEMAFESSEPVYLPPAPEALTPAPAAVPAISEPTAPPVPEDAKAPAAPATESL